VDEADNNTKKMVLWGLSNFVADSSKTSKMFIKDFELCKRTLQLTLFGQHAVRGEACWTIANALTSAGTPELLTFLHNFLNKEDLDIMSSMQ
jgi:hypothetical protein